MTSTPDSPLAGVFEQHIEAVDMAREAVRRGIAQVVIHRHGKDGYAEQSYFPGAQSTVNAPKPLLALAAALVVRDAVRAEMDRAARTARGQGASWDDVGLALGLTEDDYTSRGIAAFHAIAGEHHRPTSVAWTCATCRGTVIDRGPWEPHPADNEEGHAEDCERFRRECAQADWRARR